MTRLYYAMKGLVILIVLGVIVFCVLRFRSCVNPATTQSTVSTPSDTTFSPVVEKDYKPASTPFEKHSKPPIRMPAGVKESDIKAVLFVVKDIPAGDSTGRKIKDSTAIIVTKDGDIFIDKQNGEVASVNLITYKPPIFDLGLWCMGGVTIGDGIQPAVAISPIRIEGFIQMPLVSLDLRGVGAGIAYRWGDFSIGALSFYGFKMERQLKLIVAYNF